MYNTKSGSLLDYYHTSESFDAIEDCVTHRSARNSYEAGSLVDQRWWQRDDVDPIAVG